MNQSKTKDVNQQTHEARRNLRDFDRSLPMLLLRAREAVMKKFIPSLREHGLSPQQWRVIRSLEQEDGLKIAELSKRCYLMLPSMSRIVQNLESRQFIERRFVATDQRRPALFLTEAGHQLFEQVAPKSVERYEDITHQFGYGKLELLYELLDDLVASLDDKNN